MSEIESFEGSLPLKDVKRFGHTLSKLEEEVNSLAHEIELFFNQDLDDPDELLHMTKNGNGQVYLYAKGSDIGFPFRVRDNKLVLDKNSPALLTFLYQVISFQKGTK